MPYKDREKQLAAQRKHYQDNKSIYAARTAAQKKKRQGWANEYKDRPCEHCGVQYPFPVMHLHSDDGHVNGSVGRLVNSFASEEAIRAEAEKCTLLCANCHILHHINLGDFGFGPNRAS